MAAQYFYLPQQHPYFQFPPTLAAPDSGYRPSRSWQGSPHISPPVLPNVLPVIPAAAPVATPIYQPALLYPDYSRTTRRHSFNGPYVAVQPAAPAAAPWPTVPAPYYTYSPGWTLASMELPRPQLHNMLNGEIASRHLYLNFASADLEFKRRNGSGIHYSTTLSAYDLDQPATNPQMTRVRVVCDAIPQWPVDVHVSGTTLTPHRRHRTALPYLTLEDVIWAVHASLHRKISHEDWGRLNVTRETEISRAYTRRTKASGSTSEVRQQQAEGVKRVDFLLKNTWFKGFAWLEPESGVERLKLLLGMES